MLRGDGGFGFFIASMFLWFRVVKFRPGLVEH
jgi:hypothetical protein